nr:MAG TPA: hypothetical protein [Caudoviricetes sp.]
MAEYNIGKVIPQYKGRYNNKETYEDLDVVAHENKTFISLTNQNKETPSEESSKWRLLCDSTNNQLLENNLGTFAAALELIGQRLQQLSEKVDENKRDIFESTTLVRDSINSAGYVRGKLQEVNQRLTAIESKLK